MNKNFYLQCEICDSIHRIRVQAGYLNQYPLRYRCGKCGALIKTEIKHYPEEGDVRIQPELGSVAQPISKALDLWANSDYFFFEASGELPVKKQQHIENLPLIGPVGASTNPFFSALDKFGFEKLPNYVSTVQSFLAEESIASWPMLRAVFDSCLSESSDKKVYGLKMLQGITALPIDSEYRILEALADLEQDYFSPLYFDAFTKKITTAKQLLLTLKKEGILDLVNYMQEIDCDVVFIFRKTNSLLNSFRDSFPFLIPSYATIVCEKPYDLNVDGTSCCTIDDLKALYIDAYETLGTFLPWIIGLDNISERTSYDEQPSTSQFRTLHGLINNKSKGQIFRNFTDGPFGKFIDKAWDIDLRNALGHSSLESNDQTQEIFVYKRGHLVEDKKYWTIETGAEYVRLLQDILLLRDVALEATRLCV